MPSGVAGQYAAPSSARMLAPMQATSQIATLYEGAPPPPEGRPGSIELGYFGDDATPVGNGAAPEKPFPWGYVLGGTIWALTRKRKRSARRRRG